MPFAFIIVGTVLLISGVRNTSGDLVSLFKGDISGQKNFIYWALSILILGSLGYIEDFKPLSRALLVLVIVVLILSNGGFFQLFNQAIASISNTTSTTGVS